MMKRGILALVVTAALLLPAVARAHEGHTHRALGTIDRVQSNQLEVKTTDGKVLTIVLDAKTAITRGKDKLDAVALKVGERVSVDYTQAKNTNTAKTIKLGTAPAPAPAKK
ncbi:MAG: DUF5666 domain-containing protein [Vicinamibacterales bacterium]